MKTYLILSTVIWNKAKRNKPRRHIYERCQFNTEEEAIKHFEQVVETAYSIGRKSNHLFELTDARYNMIADYHTKSETFKIFPFY